MPFTPEALPTDALPFFDDAVSENVWVPLYQHDCAFGPQMFTDTMMNLILNPNLNSTWLFRADVLYDDGSKEPGHPNNDEASTTVKDTKPIVHTLPKLPARRTIVRKLIPRNERRDQPLNQTCSFHSAQESDTSATSAVLYIPHTGSMEDLPFYHPKVRGIAHLHQWDASSGSGKVSVHFLPASKSDLDDPKLRRVAYHLLEILHKHGEGSAKGYVKRVHHDVVVPRAKFQNRYSALKNKYARRLVESWAEKTDPTKHVFEDLGIAAFLLELWDNMYKDSEFPGFVDIGCGNGLLVYLLTQEGYPGSGFDARARKSWSQYKTTAPDTTMTETLDEMLLLPSIVARTNSNDLDAANIHDGTFKPGTFIVSNHADELTPWTPILGALSQCPFIMIPCCSHNLTGEKYRAPPPRDKTKAKSTYASLVDWVEQIAADCGWETETEMLRIPSTRNTCILGRKRTKEVEDVDMQAVIQKYGGVEGYYDNVVKLVKSGPRTH